MKSTNFFQDNPLFIIGSPRSGTSLLRLIMTTHSEVLIPPECGFIIWLNKKYNDWRKFDNFSQERTTSFINDLLNCKKIDTWMLNRKDIEEQIHIHQPTNYAELCWVIYNSFGISKEKYFNIWGDKNNFHINHLNTLIKLYKNARFLHIVRDGRDVACSYREVMATKSNSPYVPKLPTKINEIALEWSQNIIKTYSIISSMPEQLAMTVTYEDLTSAPSPTIKEICNWLEIEFENNMLNFYKTNKKNKLEPALTLDWKKRTLEPINNTTVGRYSNQLTANEQKEFLKIAVKTLRHFSYI